MGSNGKQQPAPVNPQPTINALKAPSLFETIATDRLQAFHDWEHAPGRDIMAAPGMGDLVDIYGSADSIANERNLANPGRALSGGGSGDFQAQLDEQAANERYKTRAEGLSHGLTDLKAEAYGMGSDAAQMGEQRMATAAGLESGNYNGYWTREAQKVPLWQKIAGIVVGGVQAAGGVAGLKQI